MHLEETFVWVQLTAYRSVCVSTAKLKVTLLLFTLFKSTVIIHPSLKNAPFTISHFFLSFCYCGFKKYDGIWKKINITVVGQNAKAWQAESVKSKLAITIILENKAFIFVSGEWWRTTSCSCIWGCLHLTPRGKSTDESFFLSGLSKW